MACCKETIPYYIEQKVGKLSKNAVQQYAKAHSATHHDNGDIMMDTCIGYGWASRISNRNKEDVMVHRKGNGQQL